jgi:hypothetical protein
MTTNGIAAGRWSVLEAKRQAVLRRARACAAVTIPALLPPAGSTENSQLPTPYQALGARGVNNLAAKLLLTLMPPNSPFFRFDVDPILLERLKEELGNPGVKTEISKQLSAVEQAVIKFNETRAFRVEIFKALRYLITTGNALIEYPLGRPQDRMSVYRMDQFVVRRDAMGVLKELVIRQMISPDEVPAELAQGQQTQTAEAAGAAGAADIPLFTYFKLEDGVWVGFQEVNGQPIPGTQALYPVGKLPFPFIDMAWMLMTGENYGRGHVEENLGDFLSLEGLAKALLEGAAVMAKMLFLVNPNGTTNWKDLQKAPNGGFAPGLAQDVTALQAQKYADFQVAASEAGKLEGRLARAFLLTESVQRDAERVTAEEIRMMASELEDALGGIYSILTQTLQLPMLRLLMADMEIQGKLPPLPPAVQFTITTGYEALGRGHDLTKLQVFFNTAQKTFGPQIVAQNTHVTDCLTRIASSLGLDTSGLILTAEEVAAQQKAAQQQQLMDKLGPQVTKMMGDIMSGKGEQPKGGGA